MTQINYEPAGPTLKAFHESDAYVRGIMGPVGSAKSSTCTMEILRRAALQAPGPDGVRYSRWVIIRNTYAELRTTTLKTWQTWLPRGVGRLKQDPPITYWLRTPDMDMEVLFFALDREEDAAKLLSLEVTGAWVHEAREVPKGIIDVLTTRVGRYPNAPAVGYASWYGIIMDTNPPHTEHWWYKLAEEKPPEEWEFFKQPSARSEQAENLQNLPKDYYKRLMQGKDGDWTKVYVDGEYGFVVEGKVVYPSYLDGTHCKPCQPVKDIPIEIGVDFGLTPAAIFGQKLPDGRWQVFDEFCAQDCGIQRFSKDLRAYIGREYPDHEFGRGYGDPAGARRGQEEEKTSLDIMRVNMEMPFYPAATTNDLTMRFEAVRGALNRLVDGKPGLVIDPKCKMLRKGFVGGYFFKALRSSGNSTTHETPCKNEYSHPHDGLQYLLLGGGERDVVLKHDRPSQIVAIQDYDPLQSPWEDAGQIQ